MATYSKLDGTSEPLFRIDATASAATTGIKNASGTLEVRNSDDSDFAPLRVKNDGGDNQSAMTRSAISALVGGVDAVKWFKVAFQFNGAVAGDYDFTSGTTFPDNSYIVDCRVNVTQPYDAAPNVIKVGWVAAGDTSISNGAGVDLDSGTAIFELPQIQQASTGAPMNIHVRVSESGTPTQGAGEVWVGYIQTPAA